MAELLAVYIVDNRYLNQHDSNFVDLIISDLNYFLQESAINRVFIFPPVLNRYRFLIHKTIEDFPQLASFSIGEGNRRRTVVCLLEYLTRGTNYCQSLEMESSTSSTNKADENSESHSGQCKKSGGRNRKPEIQRYVPRGQRTQQQQAHQNTRHVAHQKTRESGHRECYSVHEINKFDDAPQTQQKTRHLKQQKTGDTRQQKTRDNRQMEDAPQKQQKSRDMRQQRTRDIGYEESDSVLETRFDDAPETLQGTRGMGHQEPVRVCESSRFDDVPQGSLQQNEMNAWNIQDSDVKLASTCPTENGNKIKNVNVPNNSSVSKRRRPEIQVYVPKRRQCQKSSSINKSDTVLEASGYSDGVPSEENVLCSLQHHEPLHLHSVCAISSANVGSASADGNINTTVDEHSVLFGGNENVIGHNSPVYYDSATFASTIQSPEPEESEVCVQSVQMSVTDSNRESDSATTKPSFHDIDSDIVRIQPSMPDSDDLRTQVPLFGSNNSKANQPFMPHNDSVVTQQSLSDSDKTHPHGPESEHVLTQPSLPDCDRTQQGVSDIDRTLPVVVENCSASTQSSLPDCHGTQPAAPDNDFVVTRASLRDNERTVDDSARTHQPVEDSDSMVTRPTVPDTDSMVTRPVLPDSDSIVTEPAVPHSGSMVTRPTVPDSDSMVTRTAVPDSDSMVTQPVVPDSDSMVTQPTVPDSDSIVTRPTVPDSDSMVTQTAVPDSDSMVTQPVVPDSDSMVTQPAVPDNDSMVTQPAVPYSERTQPAESESDKTQPAVADSDSMVTVPDERTLPAESDSDRTQSLVPDTDSMVTQPAVSDSSDVATQPPVPAVLETSDDEESWDTMFDDNGDCLDPSMVEELTSRVGKVEISKPQTEKYLPYSPKELDVDMEAYSHVIEISDFPSAFTTADLMTAFRDYMKRGFDIKWVDDTHALGVFCSAVAANDALKMIHPFLTVKPLSQATRESRAKAKRCQEFLQPYKERPAVSAAAARRLVSGALGMTVRVSKEQREQERQQLKEARDKKRKTRRQKEDIWNGSFGKCAMDDV